MNGKHQRIERQIGLTLWTLAAAAALAEFVAAISVWSTGRGAIAMLWGGAFTVMGFVLGFLFGVPRSQTPDDKSKPALAVNTNLEQISDWLTKLITGAALANLRELPADIKMGGHYIAQSLAACPDPKGCPTSGGLDSIGGAILNFFLALGFLFGYLATRTFFTRLFAASDAGATLQDTVDSLPPGSATALAKAPVSLDQPPPTLDPAAATAANVLQSLPVSADAPADALLALAKAKLFSGKWDEAVAAYKAASDKKPADASTLLDYVYALQRGHSPVEVQNQLDKALDLVRAGGDKDVKRRVYEAATYLALYAPAPDGFERAIRLGEEYTRDSSNNPSGAVRVNLACGYGQKVRWLRTNRPSEDTKPLRDAAFQTAQAAINLDAQWKRTLHDLMLPSDVQAARGENDLEVFANDQEFRTLVS